VIETKTLKIYGTESQGQLFIESLIHKYFEKAELNYKIEKINDLSLFIDLKLESIPSIQLDDGTIYPIKDGNYFKQNLRKALSEILQKDNFGQLKKIVVPFDFSESSINAFMYAHRLATSIDAVTQVSHIDTAAGKNKDKFNNFISQVDIDWNSDILEASLIKKQYLLGPIKETLIKSVLSSNPHLLVIGNRGNSKTLNHIGSTATLILKELNTRVLIIPENAKFTRLKNIVFPYQNEEQLNTHLDFVIDIAKPFNAQITLLKATNGKDISPTTLLNKWQSAYKNISYNDEGCHSELNVSPHIISPENASMLTIPKELSLNCSYYQNLENSVLQNNSKIPYLSLR